MRPNIIIRRAIEEIHLTGTFQGRLANVFNVFGRRAGFTSNSVMNDVKEFDNAVANNPELSNSSLDIISSSASDAAAGTGVQSVVVFYLDSNNNIVESSPIPLNGTNLVTNVLTGVNFVLWMETETAGSGGVAAGNIRLRINGGTVEVEQITAGGNRSMSARFMVPSGYTGFLFSWNAQSANNDQDCRLRATVNSYDHTLKSGIYLFQDVKLVASNTNSGDTQLPFIPIPELAKVKISTISAGTAGTVKCETSFYYCNNKKLVIFAYEVDDFSDHYSLHSHYNRGKRCTWFLEIYTSPGSGEGLYL